MSDSTSSPADRSLREAQAEHIDGLAAWLDGNLNRKLCDALRAGAAALRALSAASPASGWRDIASAPKDGPVVLLLDAGGMVYIGYWLITTAASPCWWARDGYTVFPTHWMPLPGRMETPPLKLRTDWRLVPAGHVAPIHGGHGSWVETNHPAVIDCMGSAPPCVAGGCQYERAVSASSRLPVEDEWTFEARKTLDHLGAALQVLGVPHRVNWREWIDQLVEKFAPEIVRPLDPPLRVEAQQEEVQKDDQGAGLIHQAIPDMAGTEPRPNRSIEWALGNVYMLARRELRRLQQPTVAGGALTIERWQHVIRICEEGGARSAGVLRATLPTDITDGQPQPSRRDADPRGVDRSDSRQEAK